MASVKVARGRNVIEIDESKLADAAQRGYEPVSDEQADQIVRTKEAGTVVGGIQGQVEAAASTATFGLSDQALTKSGLVDERDLAARREGSEVGELAGAVIPTLLTGGGGAIGAAARFTPVGAVSRLGGKIAAGRGIRGAVLGNAVESAFQGAGSVLSEEALGGREITGERLAHGIIRDGLLGAGVSGTIGVGGKFLGGAGRVGMKAAGKAGDAVGGVASLMRGKGLTAAQMDKVADVWAGASSGDRDGLREMLEMVGDKEGRQILIAGPEAAARSQQKLGGEMKAGVDASNDAWEGLIEATGGDARVGNAERLMSPAERARAPMAAREFIDGEAARIKTMGADDLLTDSARRDLTESMRAAARAKEAIEAAGERGEEAFRAVDRYRQEMRVIREARAKEYSRTASPETGRSVANLDDLLGKAREHTTSETIYGAAAKAHAEDLDGWAQAIDATRELRKKSPQLGKLFERGATDVDVGPLVSLAGGRASKVSKASAFDEVIDKRLRAAEILRRNHDLAPAVKAKIDAFETATKRMRADMDRHAKVAARVDAMMRVRQTGESGFSPSNVGAQGAAALGGAFGFGVGGLPGAMIGAAAGALTRPFTAMRWLAGAREAVDKIRLKESGVLSGIGAAIDGVRKVAKPVSVAIGAGARRTATAAAIQSNEDRRRSLFKVRDEVNRMVSDPQQMAATFRDDDAFREAPGVAKARMVTAARAMSYLKGVEPVTYRPKFAGQVEMVDPVQLSAYERAVEAVMYPDETMERMADGTMTLDHARALAAVYPQRWEHMRNGVLEEVGARAAIGKPVSYQQRIQLGIILGMPLDDSMRKGWTLSTPPQAQPQQPSGPAPNARASAEMNIAGPVGTDRIEAGGERI